MNKWHQDSGFAPKSIALRTKMMLNPPNDKKPHAFIKHCIFVEGPSDRDFFKKNPTRDERVDNSVWIRCCGGLENVCEVSRLLEYEPCVGIIDWDYHWYHSQLSELTSNIHQLDTNNLESFVLFQEQMIQYFNESGASSENQFAVQCSEQIGYLRCINHTQNLGWKFKESKSNGKLRDELLDLFTANLENQNLDAFRLGALKLYKMNYEEYNHHVSKIEQSMHYSQARIVNGKDLFSFIKLCQNNSTYENLEKRFTNEMFQTTSLAKWLNEQGIPLNSKD
jgi:hypothetical protein